MSFDTIVSLALFPGALFLMMRFGCGAHMGHAHRHNGPMADETGGGAIRSTPGKTAGAGLASLTNATGALPAAGAQPEGRAQRQAHRHGCC